MRHSDLRANERYGIEKLNDFKIITDILDGNCVQIKSDFEKYSRCFMVLVNNRYVKVVTDFNVQFVKTVLPYTDKDFNFVCELANKINNSNNLVAA